MVLSSRSFVTGGTMADKLKARGDTWEHVDLRFYRREIPVEQDRQETDKNLALATSWHPAHCSAWPADLPTCRPRTFPSVFHRTTCTGRSEFDITYYLSPHMSGPVSTVVSVVTGSITSLVTARRCQMRAHPHYFNIHTDRTMDLALTWENGKLER